jgi:hypothetical protein
LRAAKETVFNVGEITRDLRQPTTVGMRRDAGAVDRSGRDVDEEQNVMCDEAPECMHLDAQKVRSRQAFPVGFQKSRPSSVSIPLRSRLDAVLTEDVGDGAASDLMSQIRERASNARVSP